ncbi:hypothetical protein UPYG_G00141730 [Umbra pygmaea]|uniref:Uncharacterized protein n=1 Tax=Umbra pygmaea TaxID=75934 RepID=A0ABD0WWU5_UMBPY
MDARERGRSPDRREGNSPRAWSLGETRDPNGRHRRQWRNMDPRSPEGSDLVLHTSGTERKVAELKKK